jgi:putative N6-adenine-specific DNA methylase
MMKLELIATATFGLEAVARREIEALGFKVVGREDGRVTYIANEAGVARSNLRLRSADRVLLKMGEFEARTFEDLFQGVRAIAWETLIPVDGNFVVNATSVKSQLSSVPAVQSVSEKAVVERLRDTYGVKRFAKTGAKYDVKIRLLKDRCTVSVDTSGTGLHKRGYRQSNVEAPIKETLAAALVQLSFWKKGRLLVDPFCGSGTIPIEAAMIGRNIAPGLDRDFVSETWNFISPEVWKAERKAAYADIDYEADVRICASDISGGAIAAARENAENAGVDDCIAFEKIPFSSFRAAAPHGIMVCNPPYGERIGEQEQIAQIYGEIKTFFSAEPTWSLFLITTDKGFEQAAMGRPADRRRKLYNGRLETTFYQYHGSKE